jgi:hypothetical protein
MQRFGYLYSDARLGRSASALIEEVIANGDHVGISSISLVEMVYLIEKRRIPAGALDDVLAAISTAGLFWRCVRSDEMIFPISPTASSPLQPNSMECRS